MHGVGDACPDEINQAHEGTDRQPGIDCRRALRHGARPHRQSGRGGCQTPLLGCSVSEPTSSTTRPPPDACRGRHRDRSHGRGDRASRGKIHGDHADLRLTQPAWRRADAARRLDLRHGLPSCSISIPIAYRLIFHPMEHGMNNKTVISVVLAMTLTSSGLAFGQGNSGHDDRGGDRGRDAGRDRQDPCRASGHRA